MIQYFERDGLKLAYQIHGESHPIICLPGLTRNMGDFDEFVAKFQDKAMVITLSYRGRDPSDYDLDFMNYNVFTEGADVVALLDKLQIDKALWLGTSRGGLITMAMAEAHMDRMAGVVFNDIGPELNPEGLMRILGYLGIPPSAKTPEEVALSLKANMGREFPTLTNEQWLGLANRWFRFDQQGAHLRYDAKLRDAVLEGGASFEAWPAFDRLSAIPMGLVWGENSDLLIEDGVHAMQARNTKLKVAKVPNRGHVPFLDEPEALRVIEAIFEESFS